MPFQGGLNDGVRINYDAIARTDYLEKIFHKNQLPHGTLEEVLISLSKLRNLIPKDEYEKRFKGIYAELNYQSAIEGLLYSLCLSIRIERYRQKR